MPPQIAAGEFQQHEIGSRHDGRPHGSEIGGVADDEGTEIEPLADPVDQSEGPEPRPSNPIGGGARDREAGDAEQDEGKPVEEQDEVCLFRDEVCHCSCERRNDCSQDPGMLSVTWSAGD